MERGKLEVPGSFSGLLNWLICGAHSNGPLFASASGDVATPSVTLLRSRVAFPEQQLTNERKKRKVHDSELLGRLFATEKWVRAASTSSETPLMWQFALEQEVASLREQLSAAVPTSPIDDESEHSSLRVELTCANAMVGKPRAEVQTGRDQLK